MELRIALMLLTLASTSLCAVSLGSMMDMTVDAKPANEVNNMTTKAPKTTTVQPTTSTVKPTDPTTVSPKTTTSTSTLPPKTTTTSTLAPETTTGPTTTSTLPPETTTAPTTTSTLPPETTTAPTTTTLPPKTTTVAPSTSTTSPVTTTVPPPAQAGVWFVKNGNITCVVVKSLITANATYPTSNGTKYIIVEANKDGNATAVQGTCNNNSQSIEIPFANGHVLRLVFVADNSSKRYVVNETTLQLNASALPDLKENVTDLSYAGKTLVIATPLTKSYKCSKNQLFNLTSSGNLTAEISIADTQIEAFRQDATVNFGDAEDCETADTPDIVPIAVGVSLGVMILIVLIAYLVGRRRSQTNGYVSM